MYQLCSTPLLSFPLNFITNDEFTLLANLSPINIGKFEGSILLVNIFTNPIVSSVPVYFNVKFGVSGRNISLLVLELLVLVVEGFIYHKYLNNKKINPYLLSLILNGSSYLLGVLINLVGV